MSLLDSNHVRLLESGAVVVLNLPDGNKISLSPVQAANAIVERHGNYGRSKITVSLTLEAEVQGDEFAVRSLIASSLANEVERLRKENYALKRRTPDPEASK